MALGKSEQAALLLAVSAAGTLAPLAFVSQLAPQAPRKKSPRRRQHGEGAGLVLPSEPEPVGVNEHHGHSHGHFGHAQGPGFGSTTGPLNSGEWVALVLSHGNAFAGGVMLATGLVHILVDALEMSLKQRNAGTNLHDCLFTPMVCCLAGILVPFFLEKGGLTIWLVRNGSCFSSHYVNVHTGEEAPVDRELGDNTTVAAERAPLIVVRRISDQDMAAAEAVAACARRSKPRSSLSSAINDYRSISEEQSTSDTLARLTSQDGFNCNSKCVVPSLSSTRLQGRLDLFKAMGSASTLQFAPLVYGVEDKLNTGYVDDEEDSLWGSPVNRSPVRRLSASSLKLDCEGSGSEQPDKEHRQLQDEIQREKSRRLTRRRSRRAAKEQHNHPEKHSHMSFATFLMFLVLSIHSLIVGFTIGTLSQSAQNSQQSAFLGLTIHKCFESLALGVSAAQGQLTLPVKLELLIYNLAAPAGIFLGIAAEDLAILNGSSQVVLLGLASGSFIYIALIEIIAEEFENEEYRILKFLFFGLGGGIMSFLAKQD
ncbi:Zinc transporter ZIP1 (DrZIP1) (Solute carrier family 39 member 1) (Zrt- and Irt-like protein 1) (ZIP-1) [Durusdinium trenchii]|uniref:Zinc transporter ZIP1 (DrZIP1) (Solute carrier family 39 member 1) (Zrt- and Irt-like protein 1) (ZIP-1) n=1 Tax=Durusdinium trenchii TaxID=1381693 RepID=A0ABP0RBX9_9DINO